MKKLVVAVAGLVVIAVGTLAVYLLGGSETATAPETAVVVEEAAPDAAAGDMAQDTAKQLVEHATEAAGTVEAAAEDMTDGAVAAVEEAIEAAGSTARSMSPDTASDRAAAALAEAVEPSRDAGEATGADIDPVLTPEGFDADAVVALIAESGLTEAHKANLTSAVETARNVPDMVESVLRQVRSALAL